MQSFEWFSVGAGANGLMAHFTLVPVGFNIFFWGGFVAISIGFAAITFMKR